MKTLRAKPCAVRNSSHLTADSQMGTRVAARKAHAFEDLLSHLSTAFVRARSDQIDQELIRSLECLGWFLKTDRSVIVQMNQASGEIHVTHQWNREGVRPNRVGLNTGEVMPWLSGRLAAGLATVIVNDRRLPPEAQRDLEYGRSLGIKSLVVIPFKVGGLVVGGLSIASVLKKRNWPPRLFQRLQLVSEIFGSAIERQRAGDENRRLQSEMRQISRAAMMGELTASLAHELNQPLGAVLSNARAARRLLAAKDPDLREVDAALDDIVRDNSRAVKTIQQLRALFQRGEGRTLPVNFSHVFHDVEGIAGPDANSKGIELLIEAPASLPVVFGDPTQLTQAVINLVNNAIDSVCESSGTDRSIVLRAHARERGKVHVVVCDSGKGIGADIMPKLFDAFFTTKSNGMGMGLAIVKTIVETHGGTIWATQNPDRGATLEFYLPATSNAG